MLFGKKKYSYMTMLIAYFKFVPVTVIIKLIKNIVVSLIPTVNLIITAKFIDTAITAVGNPDKLSGIYFPLSIIIIIMLINYYIEIFIGLVNTKAEVKIRKAVIPALAAKKSDVKFKYYEHQESVDIMERAIGNFEGNLQFFFDKVFAAWNVIAQVAGFVIILGMQLWWASIVFAITCIPSFIISYKSGQKRYDTDKEMTKIDRKVSYLFSILTGRETVEERYVYGYTAKLNEEYKEKYEYARLFRQKIMKKIFINMKLPSILTLFCGASVIAILIPSAIFPNADGVISLSIGMFTALVNAVFGICGVMAWSTWHISDFKYQLEYIKDLNKFLEFEEDENSVCLPNHDIPNLKSIEFKDVSFKYPGMEHYVLKNFSIKLISGKHYAIVGINGAGKTTLTKLLTGLYDEYEGEILINGKNLKEYTQYEIKAFSAVVYQDFCRYPLDIYNNIAIGNVNDMQDREKIENAVKIIGLSKAIDKLPKKYETPITKVKEDGVDLSGGEWQRIALARLIVNPAPLKILDEPTAALDPISESKIYEQFGEIINQNKDGDSHITIFISHRLGSTKLADEIIVISDGRAAEVGTFDELMAKSDIYADMFASQSEWYKDNHENKQKGDKIYA